MKKRKFKIARRRLDWADNRDTNLKGTPLRNNAAIEVRYEKRIDKLINAMIKDTEKEVLKIFKSPSAKVIAAEDESVSSLARIVMNKLSRKWEKTFATNAKNIANLMIGQVDDQSKRSVGFSLKQLLGGLNIKTDTLSPKLKEIIKATTEENVELIKTLSSGYMEQVKGDVMRSITQPDQGGLKGLIDRMHDALNDRAKKIKNKAKNNALDQTRKAYNNMNAERMQMAGVNEFVWNHAGGSKKPRQDHIDMNGNTYSFNDLPVIDKRTGEKGIPGQAINCKCYMTPVISFNKS